MKKVFIVHDFNLDLYMYNLKDDYIKEIKKKIKCPIKFIDVNKLSNRNNILDKINIYWGNRITIKSIDRLKNLKWVHLGSSGIKIEILSEDAILNEETNE